MVERVRRPVVRVEGARRLGRMRDDILFVCGWVVGRWSDGREMGIKVVAQRRSVRRAGGDAPGLRVGKCDGAIKWLDGAAVIRRCRSSSSSSAW